MKAEIRKNGQLLLILSHEDDMDKAALEALSKGGDITGTLVMSQEQVTKFGAPIGSIVLSNKLVSNE
jgi:hypothetical protein